MKRILILGVVLIAGTGIYYYLQLPPKFEGKFAAVHESIWKFNQVESLKEKLEIATRLQMSAILRTEDAGLSEEEKKAENAAIQLLTDTARHAEAFEKTLTPEDIATITQANPDSFFRRIKRFRTNNFNEKCSQEQYQAVRQKIGFMDLVAKATYIGPLLTLYEDEFRAGYLQKIMALLKTENRFKDHRDLAEGHYPLILSSAVMTQNERAERRTNYESKLAAAGIPVDRVKEYVLEMAAQFPSCLGGINADFVRQLQEDKAQTEKRTPPLGEEQNAQ